MHAHVCCIRCCCTFVPRRGKVRCFVSFYADNSSKMLMAYLRDTPRIRYAARCTPRIVHGKIWDMWTRKEGKPLWEFVCEMEPETLNNLIDYKHLSDVITKEEGLALLKKVRSVFKPTTPSRPPLFGNHQVCSRRTLLGRLCYP